METESPHEEKLPLPSETVKRLRESFAPLVAKLRPEDQPAVIYVPASDDRQ